jgi:hypothetical protein
MEQAKSSLRLVGGEEEDREEDGFTCSRTGGSSSSRRLGWLEEDLLGGGAEPTDLRAILAVSLRPRTVARADDKDGEGFGMDSTFLLTSLVGGFSSWSSVER